MSREHSREELEYIDLNRHGGEVDDLFLPDEPLTTEANDADERMAALREADLAHLFGNDGPLAAQLDGYESRPSQIEMALAVQRAILAREHALIEAPTGTGKSIAYLIPALLSGQRVVISTANKSLQSQLYTKELPFLRSLLRQRIDAVLVKGRSNFVCLQKWDQEEPIRNQMAMYDRADEQVVYLRRWLAETDSGDVDDLPFMLAADLRPKVVSYPDDCTHDVCDHFGDCWIEHMRDRAASAQVLITNHHLLLNALELGYAGHRLLPPADIYIIDEAHQLEQIATAVYETTVTDFSVEQLLARTVIRDFLGDEIIEDLNAQNMVAFQYVSHLSRDNTYQLEGDLDGLHRLGKRLEQIGTELKQKIDGMNAKADNRTLSNDELKDIRNHELAREVTNSTAHKLLTVATAKHDDAYVRYVTRSFDRRRVTMEIHAAPINPSQLLAQYLFHAEDNEVPIERTVVCTSATLATNANFEHFKRQCGIRATGEEHILPTVFDYGRQTLLYQPPLPAYNYRNADRYYDAAAAEIERLLEVSRGRALCLFTSWSGLEQVATRLRDIESPTIWPVRAQGDAPRNALLDWFRATDHSVLLATRSFWEGVDIPGEDLSLVVVDKMPFPTPGDPLHSARMKAIEETGQHSFAHYMLPLMTLALKQGFGRLIRRSADRGVVAILDERLTSKSYGRQARADLPPSRFSRVFRDVHKFFQQANERDAEFALNLWLDHDAVENTLRWRWQLLRLQDGKADSGAGAFKESSETVDVIRLTAADALTNLRTRIERAGHQANQYSVELRCTADLADALAGCDENATTHPAQAWQEELRRWRAISIVGLVDAPVGEEP